MLTEGDQDRGTPPPIREHLIDVHVGLPHHDWMRPTVRDWVARRGPRAAAIFRRCRRVARELRDAGRLSDSHTMSSWALEHARSIVQRGEDVEEHLVAIKAAPVRPGF